MRSLLSISLIAICLPAWSSAARAEDPKPEAKPEARPEAKAGVKTVVLHPQALPRPALKHALLPTAFEETPGNAAMLYLRAFLLQSTTIEDGATKEKAVGWLSVPLDKLPRKEVADHLGRHGNALDQLQAATLREGCDWGLPWREGDSPFTMLLPEAQAAREAGRLLALKARLQIAEGKLPDALGTLRSGYVLARRVNEQKVIISSLVAIAICSMLDEQLLELMEQPGAPNMYWALAELPKPFIDLREGLRFEAVGLHLTFKQSYLASRRKLTGEEAMLAWNQFLRGWNTLGDMMGDNDPTWKKVIERMGGVVALQFYYPGSRKNLIARGRTEKEVDAMPQAQVVLADIFESFEEVRDEQFKWFVLPFPEQRLKHEETEKKIKEARNSGNIGGVLAGMLLPALARASEAYARNERRFSALQCLEAIRYYAKEHDGKLPASLDDIKGVPIPVNSVTGRPFVYRVEGDKAILLEDGLDPQRDRRYEITIAK